MVIAKRRIARLERAADGAPPPKLSEPERQKLIDGLMEQIACVARAIENGHHPDNLVGRMLLEHWPDRAAAVEDALATRLRGSLMQ